MTQPLAGTAPRRTPSKRTPRNLLATLARLAAGATLLLFCLVNLPLLADELSAIGLVHEASTGDSYVFYDVQHFARTGIIYRDLREPPYLPAQYSPAVYAIYALPLRLFSFENPWLGPRLVALAFFLGCIGLSVSIARALIPLRSAWMWALLLALSLMTTWFWALQIRADFPGIFFGLLTVRLLLARSSRLVGPVALVALAGIAAGAAVQFKFTYVAGGAAGLLWLLAQRRWKDLFTFAIPAAVVAVGPYVLYSLREPGMLAQMLALSPGIVDLGTNITLSSEAVRDPILILALIGALPIVRRLWPRWSLLGLFLCISFTLAVLMNFQAGGTRNYYYEALFAAVPFATLGVLRLLHLAPQHIIAALVAIAWFGLNDIGPRVLKFYERIIVSPQSITARNEAYLRYQRVLNGRHIFSIVPRVALMDPKPAITEPYLLDYLIRLRKMDPEPLWAGIRNGEYDLAVTTPAATAYRGLVTIVPALHDAIADGYDPYCTLEGSWIVHLPATAHADTAALATALDGIDCQPVSPEMTRAWGGPRDAAP